jgi:uncharacterized SAM-binding protein YcdF (DUF218 family)
VFLLHLKTAIKQLLLPPAGSLVVALIGLLLLKRRPILGRTLLAVGIATLWLLSTPWVAYSLMRMAEHYPPVNLRDASSAQAIAILGGGGERLDAPEYTGPAAGPVLLERVAYGAYLSRKTGLPILVTGARIEAAAMRASLARNFDIEARWVEDRSYDTFDNARNSAAIFKANGVQRILLVTHGTHMRRAVEEFRATGLEVIPAPAGLTDPMHSDIGWIPQPDALAHSNAALNEMIGEPIRELLAATHIRRH